MSNETRNDRPRLSVVIPTYARAETLVEVIHHLEHQTLEPEAFEVVVIDDGSPDDTPQRMERVAARTPLRLRYLRQDNRGVSAARNRGVREARAPIVVILQDDMLATPGLLERHEAMHRRHPETTAAAAGRATWPPDWPVDHFMHWLEHGGPQFAYHEILGQETITYKYFYSCNVSLKRQALLDNPFDDEILYGFEDIELAHRLQARHFTFYFDEQALAYHHHRRSFEDFRRRQFVAGQSLYVALRNHPELTGKTGVTAVSRRKRLRTQMRRLALPLAHLLGARRTIEKYWRGALDEELIRGYRTARARDNGSCPQGVRRR